MNRAILALFLTLGLISIPSAFGYSYSYSHGNGNGDSNDNNNSNSEEEDDGYNYEYNYPNDPRTILATTFNQSDVEKYIDTFAPGVAKQYADYKKYTVIACVNAINNANKAISTLLKDVGAQANRSTVYSDLNSLDEVSYYLTYVCRTEQLEITTDLSSNDTKIERQACTDLSELVGSLLAHEDGSNFRNDTETAKELTKEALGLGEDLGEGCAIKLGPRRQVVPVVEEEESLNEASAEEEGSVEEACEEEYILEEETVFEEEEALQVVKVTTEVTQKKEVVVFNPNDDQTVLTSLIVFDFTDHDDHLEEEWHHEDHTVGIWLHEDHANGEWHHEECGENGEDDHTDDFLAAIGTKFYSTNGGWSSDRGDHWNNGNYGNHYGYDI